MYIDLPEELLLEILLRLPAEALVRFTAVCKWWNSVIKNPNFISTHLAKTISYFQHQSSPSKECTWDHSYRLVEKYSLRFDNEDVDEYKQLHFYRDKFRSVGTGSRVVGTCNGLVCLVDEDYNNYIVWNPVIRKAIRLPEPSVRFRNYHSGRAFTSFGFDSNHSSRAFTGFGFDSKTNDYKLLRLVDLDDQSVGAQVYSLNTNCWTSIALFREPYYIAKNSFVNGAIHLLACDWKGRRKRNLILAFDVSVQVFSDIPLPDHLSNAIHRPGQLRTGRLQYSQSCMASFELLKYRESSIATMTSWDWDPNLIELWVMKEYGVATSWTKLFTIVKGESVGRVLFFRQDEEQEGIPEENEDDSGYEPNDASIESEEQFQEVQSSKGMKMTKHREIGSTMQPLKHTNRSRSPSIFSPVDHSPRTSTSKNSSPKPDMNSKKESKSILRLLSCRIKDPNGPSSLPISPSKSSDHSISSVDSDGEVMEMQKK
ncbi:hypothetical protein CCACVL1_21266 [Corchorus capsularis]|uniref:F-box domain-containing protein n=1 Tax=Corchorus capsularis TaxID=210143 RepID=A0A1R3H759_COCAP|nr:hypothetical protein CCACVL1_21266 [Corchorus capsularis]